MIDFASTIPYSTYLEKAKQLYENSDQLLETQTNGEDDIEDICMLSLLEIGCIKADYFQAAYDAVAALSHNLLTIANWLKETKPEDRFDALRDYEYRSHLSLPDDFTKHVFFGILAENDPFKEISTFRDVVIDALDKLVTADGTYLFPFDRECSTLMRCIRRVMRLRSHYEEEEKKHLYLDDTLEDRYLRYLSDDIEDMGEAYAKRFA